jgi:hypothetical protein
VIGIFKKEIKIESNTLTLVVELLERVFLETQDCVLKGKLID